MYLHIVSKLILRTDKHTPIFNDYCFESNGTKIFELISEWMDLFGFHPIILAKKNNQIYLPPLHTPFGSVDHPKPCPHGKTHASVAFASESRVLLLKTATAASLRTSGPRTSSRCPRLDETSEFVGAISSMDINVLKFKNLLRTKLSIRMSRNSFALLTIKSGEKTWEKNLRLIRTNGRRNTPVIYDLSIKSSICGGGGSYNLKVMDCVNGIHFGWNISHKRCTEQ